MTKPALSFKTNARQPTHDYDECARMIMMNAPRKNNKLFPFLKRFCLKFEL